MSDRQIVLVKSEGMGDWYCIEWAEHEHAIGLRPINIDGYHTLGLWTSARVADADVEGTAAEMRGIADAIERGESAQFYRCAAIYDGDGCYLLSSPRNSLTPARISAEQACGLAASIRSVLAED